MWDQRKQQNYTNWTLALIRKNLIPPYTEKVERSTPRGSIQKFIIPRETSGCCLHSSEESQKAVR